MSRFEEKALIYLLKHTKIVKFVKGFHTYIVYIGDDPTDLFLSEKELLKLLLEIYEVK